MSIAQAIYPFLSGSLSVPIYPLNLPEDHADFPALTYTVDEDEDIHLLTGGISTLAQARVSIDVFDASYQTAQNTANAVETTMIGFRGAMWTDTSTSPETVYTAQQINKERRFDLFEVDTRLNHVSMQFLVNYA